MKVLALLILLLPASALADQLDYLFVCPTEAACMADPALGKFYIQSTGWDGSSTLPGAPDGPLTVTVSGAPAPGWPIMISVPKADTALDNDPHLILKTDRDMAVANPNSNFILLNPTGLTQAQLDTYVVNPTFAGSNYPFGAAP